MKRSEMVDIILKHYQDCWQIQEGDTYAAAESCLTDIEEAGMLPPYFDEGGFTNDIAFGSEFARRYIEKSFYKWEPEAQASSKPEAL